MSIQPVKVTNNKGRLVVTSYIISVYLCISDTLYYTCVYLILITLNIKCKKDWIKIIDLKVLIIACAVYTIKCVNKLIEYRERIELLLSSTKS